MTIFNSKILNEGQEYLILKLLKNWKLFMCKEVLNTILTINSSETLLWWLLALNDYNAASIDWSIVDPGVSYPADNIRIDSIYSCVKVWSWTKLWWGMIYNKQWKPAAITPPPIMWVTQLRRQQTDTAWLSLDGGGPDLQAMFDDCRTQCANYTHSTVGIYTIFSAHSYQAMSNIRTFSFRVLQTSVNMKFVWFIATIY